MANHNLPTLTSTYSNFITEMDARMDDISIGFDPALTVASNFPTGTLRWVSASNKWQKWSGSAWVDLSSAYAINISGNAASATQVSSALTLSNTGNGIASGSTFNGSTAITISYNSVGAPSVTGTGASGTWNIGISGGIVSATTGTFSGVLTAGAALREKQVTIAASNIDLSLGSLFTKTITGATTFTVSNVPAASTTASFILDLTNGGSAAVTWFASIKWPLGAPPVLTTAGRDVLGFFTHDGGITWTGVLVAKDAK